MLMGMDIMPKTISLKQMEANRRNAQKSTGPKTPDGRAVSKMNALKHGILSKEVLARGLHPATVDDGGLG
jgi:hypothetical protein